MRDLTDTCHGPAICMVMCFTNRANLYAAGVVKEHRFQTKWAEVVFCADQVDLGVGIVLLPTQCCRLAAGFYPANDFGLT